jgi:DNA-binding NarL/FixJ family response regulator
MMPSMPSAPRLLLVEPDSLVRRTVASVARTLELAEIREASTYEAAESLLQSSRFAGVIMAVADDGDGIALLERLRAGDLQAARDCPVAVLTGPCDAARVQSLGTLNVRRVILKPFKVKTVLDCVAQLTRDALPRFPASRASPPVPERALG